MSTDSSGRFVFAERLTPASSVLASAQGYRSRLQPLEKAAANQELVIELDHGGDGLSGRVVDASGGPVVGALVTLREDSDAVIGAVSSDSEGHFAMTESPGAIEVCAQGEAYSRTCRAVAGPSVEHVLVLAPESTIMGRVLTRADGRPIAGASITASNRNGLHVPARMTSSADDGTFSIGGLPAGGYEVVAVSKDSRSVEQSVWVGVGETSAPLTLWSTSAVRVRAVVLADGKPCGGGSAELTGPIWTRQRVRSDGTVEFDGIVAGRYDATADCDHALSQTVSLAIEGNPVEHVWTLEKLPGSWEPNDAAVANAPKGGTLRAIIEGRPEGVSAVFAESQDGALHPGLRRDSAFVFTGLLAGEYRVYANGTVEQAERARITRDGELVEIRLRSAPTRWITGRVLSDDGAPVPDAWVSASRSDSPSTAMVPAAPALTDHDGSFRVTGVSGAMYSLRVASPYGDARLDGVEAGKDVLVRVAPAAPSGRASVAEGPSAPDG